MGLKFGTSTTSWVPNWVASSPQRVRISQEEREGDMASRDEFMKDVESGALYVLILAFMFVEFFSTVRVADSNTATAFIKCTIYGNISMMPKKKRKKERKKEEE